MLTPKFLILATLCGLSLFGTTASAGERSPAPILLAQADPSGDAYEQARRRLWESIQSLRQGTNTGPVLAPVPPVQPALQTPAPTMTALAPVPSVSQPVGESGLPPASILPSDEFPAEMRALDNRQRLAVGDRVSFRVLEDREDPKPLVVTDSGEVEVPHVGRHKAAGKTCYELALEVKPLLERDYYHRATVIISVDVLFRTRGKVYVVGAVRQPGAVELTADEVMTVSKAILRVGGFSDFANKQKVRVQRATETGNQTIAVNVSEVWERGRTQNDISLKPDDIIFVPSKAINF
jgi:protein involved in polysaccharide export with SLBB domain